MIILIVFVFEDNYSFSIVLYLHVVLLFTLICILLTHREHTRFMHLVDALQKSSNEAKELTNAAEKATQNKKAFLRYILHEVRVPLNVIAMSLDLSSGLASKFSDSLSEAKIDSTLKLQLHNVVEQLQENISDMQSSKNSMM